MKIVLLLLLSLSLAAEAKLYNIGTPGSADVITQVICEDGLKFLLVITNKGVTTVQIMHRTVYGNKMIPKECD